MKQRLLLIIFTMVAAFAARAASVTIQVDHPERLTGSWQYESFSFTDEPMTFTTQNNWVSVTVAPVSGYCITKAQDQNGNPVALNYYGQLDLRVVDYDGDTITIETADLDELRNASFTLKIDDPSKANIARSNDTYSYLDLQSGENTVKFNTETESQIIIKTRNYNGLIYKVALDGNEIVPESSYSGQTYKADVTDGCVLEVTCNFPPVDCEVEFLLPEGVETDIFKSVFITKDLDRQDILAEKKIYVEAGSYLNLEFNNDLYSISALQFNGQDMSIYSLRIPIVEEHNTISVSAHPWGNIEATLIVDDPERITVYEGYSYNNKTITGLKAGSNKISILEKTEFISIASADRCYIKSITDEEGNTYEEENRINLKADGSSVITVESGMYSSEPVEITISVPENLNFDQVVNSVRIAGKAIDVVDGKFQALPGELMSVEHNSYDYILNKAMFTEEGAEPYDLAYYSSINSVIIKNNSTLDLDVTMKDPAISFTVTVDNPDAVNIYRAYSQYGENTPIKGFNAGDKRTFTWAEDAYYAKITIKAKDGYRLVSVMNVDEDIRLNAEGFTVSDGMNIAITSEKIERDSHAAIYLHDIEDLIYNWGDFKLMSVLESVPGIYVDGYSDGYAIVEFSSAVENPFHIYLSGGYSVDILDNPVYLNDEAVENAGNYDYNAYLTLKDGDVVRVHSQSDPEKCNVTFENSSMSTFALDGNDGAYTVTRDIFRPVDVSSPVEIFSGTRFDIVPGQVGSLSVSVNDVPVEANNGRFVFTVDKDSKVVINNQTVGVDEIGNAAPARHDVYNTQGVLVLRNADADMINRLPAGIYIFGGRKIVVK